MSERADQNAVIKAVQSKLSAMEYSLDELETNKKVLIMLRDTSEDDRVRFNATKTINDTEIKISEMRMKIFEHDNPAMSRLDVTSGGESISKININLIAPDPKMKELYAPTGE